MSPLRVRCRSEGFVSSEEKGVGGDIATVVGVEDGTKSQILLGPRRSWLSKPDMPEVPWRWRVVGLIESRAIR
jgi:hypothetical protein